MTVEDRMAASDHSYVEVWQALVDQATPFGTVEASARSLGAELGLGRSTVLRALNVLQRDGLVTRLRTGTGGAIGSVYQLRIVP